MNNIANAMQYCQNNLYVNNMFIINIMMSIISKLTFKNMRKKQKIFYIPSENDLEDHNDDLHRLNDCNNN
jgi:hypothetical protein